MDTNLDAYTEGLQLDSSGAFTLDTQHLGQSALGFQKAHSSFWLLRCMQALHLSDCARIDVQLKKRQVRLICQQPRALGAEEFFEVLRGRKPASPAFNHLRFGFLALLALQPKDLCWCGQGRQVVVSGHQCWLRDAPSGQPEGLEFTLPMLWGPLRLLGLHFAASHRLAFGRCPVYLDGRRLQPDWPPPRDSEGTVTATGLAVESYQLADTGFPFELPDLEHYTGLDNEFFWNASTVVNLQRQRAYAYPSFVYELEGGGRLCSMLVGLPQDEFQDVKLATVLLVRDGILLEDEKLDLGISGALVMADATHLSTDASGLRVVKDEAWQQLVQRAQGQLLLAARALLRHSDHMDTYVTTAIPSALAPGRGLVARAMRSTLSPVFRALMNSNRARSLAAGLRERLGRQIDELSRRLPRS